MLVGRLDGLLGRAPIVIEADGRTILIRTPLRRDVVRLLGRSRNGLRPARRLLRQSGIRVRVKAGSLPALPA